MPSLIKGKQLENDTITKGKLNLASPTVSKDPVTKGYFDVRTVNGKPLAANIVLDKTDIGLPNVDNTSDLLKPISNPQKIVFDRKLSYGTVDDFRNWFDSNLPSFNLTDTEKEGLFKYDPTDTTSSDDAIMTLIKDAKRFKRQFSGFVDVKWFGAIGDGKLVSNAWTGTDSTVAIQKALNFANDRGLAVMFNEGVYLISDVIKPKRVNNRTDYRLNFFGKGKGVSKLQGTGNTLIGKNLIEVEFVVGDSTAWTDSNIRIHDLSVSAGRANRCLYMNKVINVEIDHNEFRGGEIECVKVGDGTNDNFACYVHHNYFNTVTSNGGQNTALMNIDSHFAEIYNNVGDGGFYALNCSLNQMYIAGNTFEGYKFAGIYGKSSGGGNSKIIGNTLRPYSHFDVNAMFNGTQHGIYIESVSGGLYGNNITSNQIFMSTPEALDLIASVSSYSNMIPSSTTNIITGVTSGATGRLLGYNINTQKIQISVISGTFINETITQAGTGGTAVISGFVENHTYGISLVGSIAPNGSNIVIGNNLNGAEWGLNITSPYNSIVGNNISSSLHGILTTREVFITANNINLYGAGSHVAVKRIGNEPISFNNNQYTGTLDNVDPQMFSNITTANRNALVSPKPGLTLYDINVNKITVFNGTSWIYLENNAPELLSSKSIGQVSGDGSDINNEFVPGTITWGSNTANVSTGYGTALTIGGNTLADPWTNQFLFHTNGWLEFRQRIHTYGQWETQRIWTSRNILDRVVIGTVGAELLTAGYPPTQQEYNTLATKFNILLASSIQLIDKLIASGIMKAS